ncbi:unnamed protein product [Eruca vesicaria subsp. sativa]|uniref:Uncharacterized protein n=1 Tax=Eruca vesicaria subsp. sativa TaxID=29727 RepID=A0ABC8J6I1_ERUVS|nr:unnamed protein product [Eruca vesicaria subsp. sativa]
MWRDHKDLLSLISKRDHRKALRLDGSYMGGMKLEVTMAFDREEFNPYECPECRRNLVINVRKCINKNSYKYVCGGRRRCLPLTR